MTDWFSEAEFERIVTDALESLPERFANMIENVAITIEDEPSEEDLGDLDDEETELLGIYRGVSLLERASAPPMLPDEIAIFRGPISRDTRSRDEAVEEIRETVIHEIGHDFGLEDEELP